jgi:uncharacterized membrane protein
VINGKTVRKNAVRNELSRITDTPQVFKARARTCRQTLAKSSSYKQILVVFLWPGSKESVISFFIIISIQPLGQFWQEQEYSQATGMAPAHCILGKFLGVVFHCFPLLLDVPTFAARYLHVPINTSAPSNERWNCGREWSVAFAEKTSF